MSSSTPKSTNLFKEKSLSHQERAEDDLTARVVRWRRDVTAAETVKDTHLRTAMFWCRSPSLSDDERGNLMVQQSSSVF